MKNDLLPFIASMISSVYKKNQPKANYTEASLEMDKNNLFVGSHDDFDWCRVAYFFYKITACALLKVKVYHVFWWWL